MCALRPPMLDARLEMALGMVDGGLCADIGADHGRLSAALLWRNVAERMLVADISDKALGKARDRIRKLGLSDRAVFAVADGLDALDALGDERVQTIFILGMGGETVGGILRRGRRRLHGAALVLSAHTDLPALRAAVCEIGYRIRREDIAQDGGRYYTLMKCGLALPDEPVYTEEELWLGAGLMRARPPLWRPVLMRRERLLAQGVAAMEAAGLAKDAERLAAFRREMDYVKSALKRYEEDESR